MSILALQTEIITARLLTTKDRETLTRLLIKNVAGSYYILSNLSKGGMDYQGEPHQANYFGLFLNDDLEGVLSHNWIGSVQIFLSSKATDITPLSRTWISYINKYQQKIDCFLGSKSDVESLLRSLHITSTELRAGGRIEGLFSLDLDSMIDPPALNDPTISVRQADVSDHKLISRWRHDFFVESQGSEPGENLYKRASEEILRRLLEGSLFLLFHNEEPKSFCGVSGFVHDYKIVGPVWTPLTERGKGYGQSITAGALKILQKQGCKQAVLFTLNPQAESTYKAIGFKRIGDWRVDFPLSLNFLKNKQI
jgi:hypothetical protein